MGKRNILPIDERLIPNIFSFKYPKSKWVRLMLFFEFLFAVIAVVGTMLLVLLPRPFKLPPDVASNKSPTYTVR